jgi:hypothetical protein
MTPSFLKAPIPKKLHQTAAIPEEEFDFFKQIDRREP